jgi:NTP pyrophosphatase (non-canonical NTP hydrolase)
MKNKMAMGDIGNMFEKMAGELSRDQKERLVAEYYGLGNQLDKTVEELDELKEAIQSGDIASMPGEISDVYNMLDQLAYLMGCQSDVRMIMDSKMDRTLRRIAENHTTNLKDTGELHE